VQGRSGTPAGPADQHDGEPGAVAGSAAAAATGVTGGTGSSAAAVAGPGGDARAWLFTPEHAAARAPARQRGDLDGQAEKDDQQPAMRWRISEVIGRGAASTVYLGLNDDTGELMAVKVIQVQAQAGAPGRDLGLAAEGHQHDHGPDAAAEMQHEVNLMKYVLTGARFAAHC
jgi:hypothetical protein